MTGDLTDRTAELADTHLEFMADNALVILTAGQFVILKKFLEDVRAIAPELNFIIERCVNHAPGYSFSWDNDGTREQDDHLEALIDKFCVDVGFFR